MTYKKFAVKYKKIKMGRSLSFYAIDVNFPHEPHKMCINLEFQLEDDELEERLYDHLHSEDPKGPEGPKDYQEGLFERFSSSHQRNNHVNRLCPHRRNESRSGSKTRA